MTNRQVLVIEDNENNRVLMTKILKRGDFDISIEKTGLAGFAAACRIVPDIVLLDIQLPDIDGTEVLAKIRGEEKLADTVVIAVTSFAMAGDRERLLEAGCNGYIEKPFDPGSLIEQIEVVAGR